MVFLALVCPGIEAVMDYTGFENQLEGVQTVFTGEGKVDAQNPARQAHLRHHLAGKVLYACRRSSGGALLTSPEDGCHRAESRFFIQNLLTSLETAPKKRRRAGAHGFIGRMLAH